MQQQINELNGNYAQLTSSANATQSQLSESRRSFQEQQQKLQQLQNLLDQQMLLSLQFEFERVSTYLKIQKIRRARSSKAKQLVFARRNYILHATMPTNYCILIRNFVVVQSGQDCFHFIWIIHLSYQFKA